MADTPSLRRFLIFGEVLFDCFPDGACVLGGAPFNVAWNLQGLGADPLLISRIGTDHEGRLVQKAMQHWGMDVTGLQQDEEHPTGRVEVFFDHGQPRFEIVADQAYDHIDAHAALHSTGKVTPTMIYHGSLIRRAASADALKMLTGSCNAAVFLDLNLRAPWWSADDIHAAIDGARWLKINDEELRTLQDTLKLPSSSSLEKQALALRRQYGLAAVIVTCGADGALAVAANDQLYRQAVTPLPRLIDTVGAGDAFSAMSMLGLASGWRMDEILQRAQQFAGNICGIRGATSHDRELYQWP